MKRIIYIILTAIAILYFIAYPMALGLWYLASQIWGIPEPAGFGQSRWFNLALVNILLFGGLARISPYMVSKETQNTTLYRWLDYIMHMIAFVSLAFLILGIGITVQKTNYLLFIMAGAFVVIATLLWSISRPLQILSYLPDKWLAKWIMGEQVFQGKQKRVLEIIDTPRLYLLALKQEQLYLYLHNPSALEEELEIHLSHDILTESVTRALGMKIEKMSAVNVREHPWYTYWLVVPKDKPSGIGLAGFKGVPNEYNSTEIGYGIDPAYQNQGYMTEAVKALVDWAFQYPFCYCQSITATEVRNPTSRHLLEKLGARLVFEDETSTNWEFVNDRPYYSPRHKS